MARAGGSPLQPAAATGEPGRAELTALAEELARLFPRAAGGPVADGSGPDGPAKDAE